MNNIQSPAPTTGDGLDEQMIRKAKADVAPRVTPADLEANIVSEHYCTAAQGVHGFGCNKDWFAGLEGPFGEPGRKPDSLDLLTFCILVLKNGFTVTGESAVASPANFNADIGKSIARANAVAKIWPLMGYELRTNLMNTPPVAPGYKASDVVNVACRQNMLSGLAQASVKMKDGSLHVIDLPEYTDLDTWTPHDLLNMVNKQASATA
jgi:hypothetical protein